MSLCPPASESGGVMSPLVLWWRRPCFAPSVSSGRKVDEFGILPVLQRASRRCMAVLVFISTVLFDSKRLFLFMVSGIEDTILKIVAQ